MLPSGRSVRTHVPRGQGGAPWAGALAAGPERAAALSSGLGPSSRLRSCQEKGKPL